MLDERESVEGGWQNGSDNTPEWILPPLRKSIAKISSRFVIHAPGIINGPERVRRPSGWWASHFDFPDLASDHGQGQRD